MERTVVDQDGAMCLEYMLPMKGVFRMIVIENGVFLFWSSNEN